jgi:hypothetical protein
MLDKSKIEQFFVEYERRTNNALTDDPVIDAVGTADAFTDCFIESNPKGVLCGYNNEEFKQQIPKGYEFYRSIGTCSMQVQSVDTTTIDEFHTMAKVSWKAYYRKKDNSELQIDFIVVYFLKEQDGKLKIFCHITGDEEGTYRKYGLTPGQ